VNSVRSRHKIAVISENSIVTDDRPCLSCIYISQDGFFSRSRTLQA